MTSKSTVLVTGGSGLLGKAIQHVLDTEPLGSRFGKKSGETWVFVSSKDADLRFGLFLVTSERDGRTVIQGRCTDGPAVRQVQAYSCYSPRRPRYVDLLRFRLSH